MRNARSALVAITLGAMALGTASAADRKGDDSAGSDYRAAIKRAESTYRIGSERCRKLPPGQREPCLEEAKSKLQGDRMHAKTRQRSASARAEAKRKADDRAARDQCEWMRAKQRNACLDELEEKSRRN